MFPNRNCISQPQSLNTSFNNSFEPIEKDINSKLPTQSPLGAHIVNFTHDNNKFYFKSQAKMKGLQSQKLGDKVLQFKAKYSHNKLKARHKRYVTTSVKNSLGEVHFKIDHLDMQNIDQDFEDNVLQDKNGGNITNKYKLDEQNAKDQQKQSKIVKSFEAVKTNLNFSSTKKPKINSRLQSPQMTVKQRHQQSTQQSKKVGKGEQMVKTRTYKQGKKKSTLNTQTQLVRNVNANLRQITKNEEINKKGIKKGCIQQNIIKCRTRNIKINYIQQENKKINPIIYSFEQNLQQRQVLQQQKNTNSLCMDTLKYKLQHLQRQGQIYRIMGIASREANGQQNKQNSAKNHYFMQVNDRLKLKRPAPLLITPKYKQNCNVNRLQNLEPTKTNTINNQRINCRKKSSHTRTLSTFNLIQNLQKIQSLDINDDTFIDKLYQQLQDEQLTQKQVLKKCSKDNILPQLQSQCNHIQQQAQQYQQQSCNDLQTRLGLKKVNSNQQPNSQNIKNQGQRRNTKTHSKTSSLTITNIENINNQLDLGLKIIDDSFEISVMEQDYCFYASLDNNFFNIRKQIARPKSNVQKDDQLFPYTSTDFKQLNRNANHNKQNIHVRSSNHNLGSDKNIEKNKSKYEKNNRYIVHISPNQIEQIVLDQSVISPQCRQLKTKLNIVLSQQQNTEKQVGKQNQSLQGIRINLTDRQTGRFQIYSEPVTTRYNLNNSYNSQLDHNIQAEGDLEQLIIIQDVNMVAHYHEYHTTVSPYTLHHQLQRNVNIHHPNIINLYNYQVIAQRNKSSKVKVYKQPVLLCGLYEKVYNLGSLMEESQGVVGFGWKQLNSVARQLIGVLGYLYQNMSPPTHISNLESIQSTKKQSTAALGSINSSSHKNQYKNYSSTISDQGIRIMPQHIYLCSSTSKHQAQYSVKLDLSYINMQFIAHHDSDDNRDALGSNSNNDQLEDMVNGTVIYIRSEDQIKQGIDSEINTSRRKIISPSSHQHTENHQKTSKHQRYQDFQYKGKQSDNQIELQLAHNLEVVCDVLQFLASIVNEAKNLNSNGKSSKHISCYQLQKKGQRNKLLCTNFIKFVRDILTSKCQKPLNSFTFCQAQQYRKSMQQKIHISKILLHPYMSENYEQLGQSYYINMTNILY